MTDSANDNSDLGRPPMYEKAMAKTKFTLPEEYVALAEHIGEGNRSEGIRRIIRSFILHSEYAEEAEDILEELGLPLPTHAGK